MAAPAICRAAISPAAAFILVPRAHYRILDDWDTVGGFLFGTLEHVPEEGESVVRDGWRFSAAEMEGRRVRRVKVALEHVPTDDDHTSDDRTGDDRTDAAPSAD